MALPCTVPPVRLELPDLLFNRETLIQPQQRTQPYSPFLRSNVHNRCPSAVLINFTPLGRSIYSSMLLAQLIISHGSEVTNLRFFVSFQVIITFFPKFFFIMKLSSGNDMNFCLLYLNISNFMRNLPRELKFCEHLGPMWPKVSRGALF